MKRILIHVLALHVLALSTSPAGLAHAQGTAEPALIPLPQHVEREAGEFLFTSATRLLVGDKSLRPVARVIASQLRDAVGFAPAVSSGPQARGRPLIRLELDRALGREAYHLTVNAAGVRIVGGDSAGVFYGAQTMLQLLPVRATPKARVTLPALRVEDAPRFGWRGMHLDVSRHFFTVPEVERFIDHIALYKFNRLHLHLTDDEGWRLEIKRYPKLTEEGAWRTPSRHDADVLQRGVRNPDFQRLPEERYRGTGTERRYGGFYTQADMRALIAYATARQITIVPEIDMPGHVMAAITSYPELSCTGQAAWGATFSVPLCPGKAEVYTFVENVLDEVAALFPGQYIHIGGDEVEKTTWKEDPGSQALMQREGLKDVQELQGYFIGRVEAMLRARGKKLIGWDEIVDGGVSPTATIMYWRGWVPSAPAIAARRGNDVIMSPTSCCYFDAEESDESLRSVFEFHPVPDGLTTEQAAHILGVQANLWSEYIPTTAQLEYQAFPRMLALADVAWTGAARPDWPGFQRRVAAHYPRLNALGVHYRVPPISGLYARNVFTHDTTIVLTPPVSGVALYYTTDGSLPTRASTPHTVPVQVRGDVDLRVRPFYPTGLGGPAQTIRLERQSLRPADRVTGLLPGLRAEYYPIGVNTVQKLTGTPASVAVAPDFVVPAGPRASTFGMIFSGYLRIPEDGVYTFTVASDDGSALYLGERLVVDNDGPHSRRGVSGQVALSAGLHPVRLLFFEGGGGYSLQVEWEGPSLLRTVLPAGALFHEPGL
ncbi:MAG: family 20 glycosylhydrolase [Gemmatimonadaceae bacterium]